MDFKLSILIPTLEKRSQVLTQTVGELNYQILECNAWGEVEVLIDSDNGEVTTGEKRNRLIDKCKGKYFVFFDDDDEPLAEYVRSILKATDNDPDVIPINGYMTTNGHGAVHWDMGLGFGYGTKTMNGVMVYDRFPNHIAAMKKDMVKDFKFLPITRGEDYEWAKRINDSGVLKTECRIIKDIYHYKFIENK